MTGFVPNAPRIWTLERPFKALGLVDAGCRMTVLGLEDGRVLVHSPVKVGPGELEALSALGTVRAVIAPNRWHHLFFGPMAAAFPEAERWAAPGLPRKRRDLSFTGELGAQDPRWPGVQWHVLEGSRLLGEVVFFHEASGTLVVTDLFFHHRSRPDPLTRTYYRVNGTYGRFGTGRIVQAGVWDRDAARRSARIILGWPIQRIVMAHGEIVDAVTPGRLEEAFDWLLG